MSYLFENAIDSLRLGVEDFAVNSKPRTLSAVRNFYAGALLLAKEVLCRHAPQAPMDLVIASKYTPTLDGNGSVNIVHSGYQTIDFSDIQKRFKEFDINLAKEDFTVLEKLQKLRNDIEHKYTNESHQSVLAAIAQTFPVVIKLLHLCAVDPQQSLKAAWEPMMAIQEAYDLEKNACIKTFSNVVFPFDELAYQPFHCDQCDSELVQQTDTTNDDHKKISCICKICGNQLSPEKATEEAIANKYSYEIYKDGGIANPLGDCPACGLCTYMLGEGCIWCKEILGECGRCEITLTPNTISADNDYLCDYCGHMTTKDD